MPLALAKLTWPPFIKIKHLLRALRVPRASAVNVDRKTHTKIANLRQNPLNPANPPRPPCNRPPRSNPLTGNTGGPPMPRIGPLESLNRKSKIKNRKLSINPRCGNRKLGPSAPNPWAPSSRGPITKVAN